MSYLKLGEQDQDGRQKRIEHTGRHLRVSRTGGVSLRKQVRLKGVNITANTRHGVRVSHRVANNTQVALQNNRLVLRGRYGRGANRLNLSKSGVSVSTKTKVGTYNWVKPNASSIKLAGVQVRGKKAANLYIIYALFNLMLVLVQVGLALLAMCLKIVACLLLITWGFLFSVPSYARELQRMWRNKRIELAMSQLDTAFVADVRSWNEPALYAAVLLVFSSYGRGVALENAAQHSVELLSANPSHWPLLTKLNSSELAPVLESLANTASNEMDARRLALVWVALFAQTLKDSSNAKQRVDYLLQMDEFLLVEGPKTVFQETLIQVFADFTELRFMVEDSDPTNASVTPTKIKTPWPTGAALGESSHQSAINVNTASAQQLTLLPHISPQRAAEIIQLRPIRQLSELKKVRGIGPARLRDIELFGVRL